MSLGISSTIEEEILQYLEEQGSGLPAAVAWWRFEQGMKPLLSIAEIGELMMTMEWKSLLVFIDGVYKKV